MIVGIVLLKKSFSRLVNGGNGSFVWREKGIIFQSAIFSLAHFRSDIGLLALIPFLTGLFLFGLVLTLRRTIDQGSLWGCIGLHGGLVGIWYLFDSGMVIFQLIFHIFWSKQKYGKSNW